MPFPTSPPIHRLSPMATASSPPLPPPPPPPSPSSNHSALPASAFGHHHHQQQLPPRLLPFPLALAAVLGPASAAEPPPAPRRPPPSRRLRLPTVGKRGCQDYRIGYGYSSQFFSGCHCFSGEVLGMEVITQEARSANDLERNPSEHALGTISMPFLLVYSFPMLKDMIRVHGECVGMEGGCMLNV